MALAAPEPRRRSHALVAWATLMWALLTALALVAVMTAHVTICRLPPENLDHLDWQHVFFSTCNFQVVGWIPLTIGAVMALLLVLILDAYERHRIEVVRVPARKRLHRIPARALKALGREDTPHRRKSMVAFILGSVLALGFYVIVAYSPIAFESTYHAKSNFETTAN